MKISLPKIYKKIHGFIYKLVSEHVPFFITGSFVTFIGINPAYTSFLRRTFGTYDPFILCLIEIFQKNDILALPFNTVVRAENCSCNLEMFKEIKGLQKT